MKKQDISGWKIFVAGMALFCFAATASAFVSVESLTRYYTENLAKIESTESSHEEAILAEYYQALDKQEANAQQEGDLEGVLRMREERKATQNTKWPRASALNDPALAAAATQTTERMRNMRSEAERARLQLANLVRGQLDNLRRGSEALGDRETVDRVNQALASLFSADTEEEGVSDLPALPEKTESLQPPVATVVLSPPPYVKSLPRMAPAFVLYSDFTGLPQRLNFAGESSLLSIKNVIQEPKGFKGASAQFSGERSRMVSAYPKSFQTAREASLCIWFKTTGIKGTLVCMYKGDDAGVTMYVNHEGKLEGHAGHTSNGQVVSPKAVNDGQWHFAVFSAGNGRITLYLDGAKVASAVSKGNVVDANANLLFGATENKNFLRPEKRYYDWYLRGELDEFLLFNKAINDNEVRTLYHTIRSANP